MKILWLCNKELNIISKANNKPINPFGGWLEDLSKQISQSSDMQLVCLYPSEEINEGVIARIGFYSFREGNCLGSFNDILRKEQPDVIHIFGTEFGHSYAMTEVAAKLDMIDRVVISIQGLVSIYEKHYTAYLPERIVHKFSLRDLLKLDNIRRGQMFFGRRGKKEIEALRNVKHVIGRTDWDEACVKMINPNAIYHFCNETLRDLFYETSWDVASCERHSIFVSQCVYPIKGVHLLLEAMPHIIARYPDARIYIGGRAIADIPFYRRTSYQNYLLSLIRDNKLEEHVVFCNQLSEQQMVERYIKANVFVSTSSIENSPNSLGEAMLVGCPCISSDVGGVKNMLEHNIEGFTYPADEAYMIPYYIGKIFESDKLATRFSENASFHARKTHNKVTNFMQLRGIYIELMKGKTRED